MAVFLVLVSKLPKDMTVHASFMISVLRTDGGDPGTHLTRGGDTFEFSATSPIVGWPDVVPLSRIDTFLDSNGDLDVHVSVRKRMEARCTFDLHRTLTVRKEPMETPGFMLSGLRWFLRVFPMGVKGDGTSAGLYLVLDSVETAHQQPKVILQDGWKLQYGSKVRVLADTMLQPGSGRGFARFVELDAVWDLLLRSREFITASVTLADLRVCRPPPWRADALGDWVRETMPDKEDEDRMDRLLERVAKLVEDNLDYPVKEVLRSGSFVTNTALAGSMDATLVVRMRERSFKPSMVPTYKRDCITVINTGLRSLELVWGPATPKSLFLTLEGFHIEITFTAKPPAPPAMDLSDTSSRPDEVSPTAGVKDPAHRHLYVCVVVYVAAHGLCLIHAPPPSPL